MVDTSLFLALLSTAEKLDNMIQKFKFFSVNVENNFQKYYLHCLYIWITKLLLNLCERQWRYHYLFYLSLLLLLLPLDIPYNSTQTSAFYHLLLPPTLGNAEFSVCFAYICCKLISTKVYTISGIICDAITGTVNRNTNT